MFFSGNPSSRKRVDFGGRSSKKRDWQDINNISVKKALSREEKFFREKPILVQHIDTVLPGLKSRVNAQLVAVAKEHAAYSDVPESKGYHGGGSSGGNAREGKAVVLNEIMTRVAINVDKPSMHGTTVMES